MTDSANDQAWKNPAIWGRVVFTILFLLAFILIAAPLAVVFSLVQATFTIFTGEANRRVGNMAGALANYTRELLDYVSWNNPKQPFPFSDFPEFAETGAAENSAVDSDSNAAASKPAEEPAAGGDSAAEADEESPSSYEKSTG